MKRIVLLAIISVSLNYVTKAQTWSGSTPGNIYYNQGNVGIGTSTSPYQLTIRGPYYSPQALISYDGSNGIFFHAQGTSTHPNWLIGQQRTTTGLEFTPSTSAGGTTFTTPTMVLKADGYVGIGTTSPGYKLEVKDGGIKISHSSGPAELIMVGGQSGAVSYAIRNQRTGVSNAGFEIFDATNNLSRIAIDGTGNIGIGTASPLSLLDIKSAPTETVKTLLSISNPLSTTALNNGVAITLGSTANSYYTKIATVFEGQNPDYLQPALAFYTMRDTYMAGSEVERMRISSRGNVLIGKSTQINSAYKLDVNGNIRANEVVVNTNGADFVFADEYNLPTLSEVEKFINENNRLPGIVPASEMQESGMNLSEMQTKLLQKIEELTLYIIEQNRKNELQSKKIELLKRDIDSMKICKK